MIFTGMKIYNSPFFSKISLWILGAKSQGLHMSSPLWGLRWNCTLEIVDSLKVPIPHFLKDPVMLLESYRI